MRREAEHAGVIILVFVWDAEKETEIMAAAPFIVLVISDVRVLDKVNYSIESLGTQEI